MSGVVEGAKKVVNAVQEVNPISVVTKAVTRNMPSVIKNDKILGGALNQLDNAADAGTKIIRSALGGKGPTQSIQAGIGPQIQNSKQMYGNVLGQIKGESAPLPTVAPEDPAAVAAADKRDKARAKRKAQVDLLTDRPGRGGVLS